MAFVKKFNMDGELKKLTRGKALFIPSETSLNEKFKSMGLVKNYGSYDFNNYKLGPYRRAQFLRWVQLRLVKSRDTFEKLLNKQPGLKLGMCQAVEGASLYGSSLEPNRPSNCTKPNFDAFMSAKERIAFDGFQEWIGVGYNVLKGNPLVIGNRDPGISLSPFLIDSAESFTQREGDSNCVKSLENTISTSAKELQESTGTCAVLVKDTLRDRLLLTIPLFILPATKLGVDSSYAKVAFTASAEWGNTFESKSSSEAATIVASTNVRVASAQLKDTLSLSLCSTFMERVEQGIKNPSEIKSIIRTIVDNYGMFVSSPACFVQGRADLTD